MATFQCFLLPHELDTSLIALAQARDLSCCYYKKHDNYQILSTLPDSFIPFEHKFFLIPKDQNPSDYPFPIRPRDMGWIQITPGNLSQVSDQKILTLSSVQTEDAKELNFRPSGFLRWLKNYLKPNVRFGVEAINIKFGGGGFNKNICYSMEALNLLESGTYWKQYIDGNIKFMP